MKLRIVAWNCAMAFHRKSRMLRALQPDIAIVPECANLETLSKKGELFEPGKAVWVGEKSAKGLGVFSFGPWKIELDPVYDPTFQILAPIRVTGPAVFNLLAVWSSSNRHLPRSKRGCGPVLDALSAYDDFCRERSLVVAGDFNNNVNWDRPGKASNFSAVVAALGQSGLESCYHRHRNVDFGRERDATLYWRTRKADGPRYHVDYVFAPIKWMEHLSTAAIGAHSDWVGKALSDHAPVIVEFMDT
jgi:exodeoxyribonuclease-3